MTKDEKDEMDESVDRVRKSQHTPVGELELLRNFRSSCSCSCLFLFLLLVLVLPLPIRLISG